MPVDTSRPSVVRNPMKSEGMQLIKTKNSLSARELILNHASTRERHD
jgi:hypothetical protein